jgi:hypothetical protein
MIQHLATGWMLYVKKVIHKVFWTCDWISTGQKFCQLIFGERGILVGSLD